MLMVLWRRPLKGTFCGFDFDSLVLRASPSSFMKEDVLMLCLLKRLSACHHCHSSGSWI